MELDMYLYRVRKPNMEKDNTYRYFELADDVEVFPRSERLCNALYQNAVPVKIIYSIFNEMLIGMKYGIPDIAKTTIIGRSNNGDMLEYTLACYNKKGIKICEVVVPENEMEEVCIERVEESMAVALKKIAYQKNGLNDDGLNLLPANCTYSNNKKMIEELVKDGGLKESFLTKWGPNTVFIAWW